MKLSDILEQLTYGELSQLNMGGWSGNEVRQEDLAKVVSHINMGLLELHKRFWLRSSDVIIQLYDHIQTYTLDRRYAITNVLSTELYKYIVDSQYEPFQDNVLRIEQVYNEGGELLFLNDLTEPWSVFTPSWNSIQIPFPERHNSLLVHYRAAHPLVRVTPETDAATVDIDIPPGLLEPLLLYVGARAYSALNSDGNAEGNNYLQKFEASCKIAEANGMQIHTNYGNLRLDQKGWV